VADFGGSAVQYPILLRHRDAEDAEGDFNSETAGHRSLMIEMEILCVLHASAVNPAFHSFC
jgi:hypothetical protein